MDSRNIVTSLTLAFSLGAIAVPAAAQKIYCNGDQAIRRANLDGTGVEVLVDLSPNFADQIALDQSHGKIYWTLYSPALIRRANLDGTEVETVHTSYNASAIAIDEINGHIYWSDGFDFGLRVRRSDLDGQNVQDILDTNNFLAIAIELDVAAGKIYLIFDAGYLMRANLDGSQAEVIHDDHGAAGIALALDLVNRKIYWSEITYGPPQHSYGLFRSNLDGTEVEMLPFPTSDPGGVEVDPCNQRIYWSEWDGGQFLSISSVRFDGTDPRSFSSAPAWDLELALPYFNPNQEPRCIPTLSNEMAALLALFILCSGYLIHRRRVKEAPCSSRVARAMACCATIVVRRRHGGFLLFGSEEPSTDDLNHRVWRVNRPYTLEGVVPMKTQHFVFLLVLVGLLVATPGPAFAQKIYWNGGQTIQRANLDGTGTEDLVELNPSEIIRITLDQSHEKIYWSEYFAGLIRRANLDGTNVETVLGPTDLAGDFSIDEINGHIYWANGSMLGYYVSRSDLDGQNVQDVLHTDNFEPYAIALDVAGGKIYVLFETCYLMRSNLDGSQVESIFPCQEENDNGFDLALDMVNREMYWTAGLGPPPSFNPHLFRSNLDGTEFEILPFPSANSIGVAVDPCNRRIYWSETDFNQFMSISSVRFDGTDPRSFSTAFAGDIALALPGYNPNGDPKCIPTLSNEMAFLLALFILCSGYIIHRRRVKEASCSRLAVVLGGCVLLSDAAGLQRTQGNDLIAVFDGYETPLGRVAQVEPYPTWGNDSPFTVRFKPHHLRSPALICGLTIP